VESESGLNPGIRQLPPWAKSAWRESSYSHAKATGSAPAVLSIQSLWGNQALSSGYKQPNPKQEKAQPDLLKSLNENC